MQIWESWAICRKKNRPVCIVRPKIHISYAYVEIISKCSEVVEIEKPANPADWWAVTIKALEREVLVVWLQAALIHVCIVGRKAGTSKSCCQISIQLDASIGNASCVSNKDVLAFAPYLNLHKRLDSDRVMPAIHQFVLGSSPIVHTTSVDLSAFSSFKADDHTAIGCITDCHCKVWELTNLSWKLVSVCTPVDCWALEDLEALCLPPNPHQCTTPPCALFSACPAPCPYPHGQAEHPKQSSSLWPSLQMSSAVWDTCRRQCSARPKGVVRCRS